jgi:hypothetical protein
VPGTRSGEGIPEDFLFEIHQSRLAFFSWTGTAGSQNTYVLATLGSPPTPYPIFGSAGTISLTGLWMEGPTCYILLVVAGSRVIGNTDVVCGAPGVARLAPDAGVDS